MLSFLVTCYHFVSIFGKLLPFWYIKFSSPKNTFKKTKCLDNVVGVLRYMACKDDQRVGRRGGLVTHPHTHARQPINIRCKSRTVSRT